MSSERQKYIRNFSIIAHIDHGKSTLADRLIEKTGLLTRREMKEQILDSMDLERERGITIKLQTTRLVYQAKDGHEYLLNLIDTPGHVDFTYEVSRSLAACEGAILVVDATQGVEAQTLANVHLADEQGLVIVPVLNKIDLPSSRPEEIIHEIEELIGIIAEDAPQISAKDGTNVEEVLERIVRDVPPPDGPEDAPLKALIFDSYYDPYKGAVAYIRIMEGSVKKGDKIMMMAAGKKFDVVEVGISVPGPLAIDELRAGDVGYIAAGVKNVIDCRVGDTITSAITPTEHALPGYKKATSMVFCGIYPAEGESYDEIRDALEKLQLNDAALSFEPETSVALGFGFRCGFLGLLHLEIIQQ
ncbi:MAG TPA: translation elongation factor 4, partial [Fusibacter sp.]|nr:translation elongation factor 4 [Fusibacter sp.]